MIQHMRELRKSPRTGPINPNRPNRLTQLLRVRQKHVQRSHGIRRAQQSVESVVVGRVDVVELVPVGVFGVSDIEGPVDDLLGLWIDDAVLQDPAEGVGVLLCAEADVDPEGPGCVGPCAVAVRPPEWIQAYLSCTEKQRIQTYIYQELSSTGRPQSCPPTSPLYPQPQ